MSYVSELRALVGHMPLQLPGANVIVFKQAHEETAVLLQFRSDHRRLGFPGGGIENGEDYPSCAARELFEETGLSCEPSKLNLMGVYAGGEAFKTIHPNGDIVHHTIVMYSIPFESTEQNDNVLDCETVRLQWCTVSQIREMLKDSEDNFFHCHIPIFRDLAEQKLSLS